MKNPILQTAKCALSAVALLGICQAAALAGQTGQQGSVPQQAISTSTGSYSAPSQQTAAGAVGTANASLNAANQGGSTPGGTYTPPTTGQTDTVPQQSISNNSQYKQDPTPSDYGSQYPGQGQ